MDEGLDRSGSDHRFKNEPDDGVNLLLDERVPHGLDKVKNGRQKKAVFFNQNERMSTSTIAPDFPSRAFDALYFFGVRQFQISITCDKVIKYCQNCSKHYMGFDCPSFGCDHSWKKNRIDD